ncbi:MAG: glycosyltransferase family 9 protein [Planctomycetota bacterium]
MTRPLLSGGRDERILVVRTRYVGDTVMAIPFLRNLRTRYPEARIEVLVEKVSGAVLADCPYHDGLVSWDLPRPGHRLAPVLLTNQFRLAACLRERRYTRAYVLKRALSSILPVWLAGIPHRVGFAGGGRAAFLSRSVAIPPHRHEVELFLDLLRADGIAIDDGRNENWVSEAGRETAAALESLIPAGRKRVFLSPKSTSWQREWPEGRWGALVARLVRERDCDVVFCGSPVQMPFHRQIVERAGPLAARHSHDWSQRVSLAHLGALLARMDLCIGVDSGPVHVAASHGTPVVVLVGPTDPNHWCPWDAPAVVVRGALKQPRRRPKPATSALRWEPGEATMESIPVAAVWDAALGLLTAPATERPRLRAAG